MRGARAAAARPPQPRALTREFRHAAAGFKQDAELCEYDLDNEDEDWLDTYNGAQNRLPSDKCAPARRGLQRARVLTRRRRRRRGVRAGSS